VSSQEEFHTFADESEDSFHTLKDDSQDEFHTLKGVEELEEDQYSGLGLLSLPTEASPPRNQQRSKFWSENDDFFHRSGYIDTVYALNAIFASFRPILQLCSELLFPLILPFSFSSKICPFLSFFFIFSLPNYG
jgi:hypothetical protein